MERNLDLVRVILIETDKNQQPEAPIEIAAPGYSPSQIAYHVQLLAQAGLIRALDFSAGPDADWRPTSLTWQGHEFLAAARNESIWHQVKARLKDRGLDAPLSIVQQLAIQIAASMLGL